MPGSTLKLEQGGPYRQGQHRAGWLRTRRCQICPIRRSRELAEVARRFASDLDLGATLERVAQEVAELFGGSCLVQLAPAGEGEAARCALRHASLTALTLTSSICGGCPGHDEQICGRLRRLKIVAGSPRPIAGPPEPARPPPMPAVHCSGQALLSAPLFTRGREIGLVAVVRHTPGAAYSDADRGLLQDLAGHAALAIDNARIYESALGYARDLQRAAQEREQQLAQLIHDLKNPLTVISAGVPMLRKRIAELSPAQEEVFSRSVEHINLAASRLASQVAAIPLAGQAEAADSALQLSMFDLAFVVRVLAELYQPLDGRHRLLAQADLPELTGRWSRPGVEALIDNLLANAIKYSPEGGEIRLRLTREEGPAGPLAVLTISDQGIGIPADEVPYVFQRLYRASNVGQIPGSGLGLASARRIVELHGGSISLSSELGAGTAVTVWLPIA